MAHPRRPDPEPLETDDVLIVGVGTALWALALLVLVALRLAGSDDVRGWWMQMCVAGIALGLIGMRYAHRRHQRLTARAGSPAS